jgi:Flp pilus assembly pilin Flp
MTDDDPEKRPAENWSLDAGDGSDATDEGGTATARSADDQPTNTSTEPMTPDSPTDALDAARLRQLIDYGLLAAFVIVALFAALSFYSQVGRAIDIWVATPYQPIAKAAVNLALLLIAVAGVSRSLAQLTGGSDETAEPGE